MLPNLRLRYGAVLLRLRSGAMSLYLIAFKDSDFSFGFCNRFPLCFMFSLKYIVAVYDPRIPQSTPLSAPYAVRNVVYHEAL